MAPFARIESVDVLTDLKVALVKFMELASTALIDAESELHRTVVWLDTQQTSYWKNQIRKRTELKGRAEEALRQKRLWKDSSGRVPSAIDEIKALEAAKRSLAEAEQKLANVQRYRNILQKEIHLYKGAVQGLATSVHNDLPTAVAHLTKLSAALEAYLSLKVPTLQMPELDLTSASTPIAQSAPADEVAEAAADDPASLPEELPEPTADTRPNAPSAEVPDPQREASHEHH